MPSMPALDSIPIWGLFLLTIASSLIAVEAGFRLGRAKARRTDCEKEDLVGTLVTAVLGMLAFMLAFTFGSAASRYDERRELVLTEANAIGTCHLRAGFLPEPHRAQVRGWLREYVDVRLGWSRTGELANVIRASEELQGRMWTATETVGAALPDSMLVGEFVESLNDVIDVHAERVVMGLRARIPFTIWCALYLVTFLTMASMGYHAGLCGNARSIVAFALILAFGVVIMLIVDLDRPREGLLQVDMFPLQDLQRQLGASGS